MERVGRQKAGEMAERGGGGEEGHHFEFVDGVFCRYDAGL